MIPSCFQKLGIKLEKRGDDIFIPQQNSYEVQSFIDGSILTIADAPWPGFTPDLLSIVLVRCHSSQRKCFDSSKNV